MSELLQAFGRGVIKVLISLFFGTGVGLLTFGVALMKNPNVWSFRDPPGELFLAVGAGLLTSGGLLMALFLLPRLRKPAAPIPAAKVGARGDWAE